MADPRTPGQRLADELERRLARIKGIDPDAPTPSISDLERRYEALSGRKTPGPSAAEIAKMSEADRLVSQITAGVEFERQAEAARQQKFAGLEARVDKLWVDSLPSKSDQQLKQFAEHYEQHVERLQKALPVMNTAKGQQGIQQQLNQAQARLKAVRGVMQERGINLIKTADNASLQQAERQLSKDLAQLKSQRSLFKSEKYSAKHDEKIARTQAFVDAAQGELAKRGLPRLTTQTPTTKSTVAASRTKTPTPTTTSTTQPQRQVRTVAARKTMPSAQPKSKQARALMTKRDQKYKLAKDHVSKAKEARAKLRELRTKPASRDGQQKIQRYTHDYNRHLGLARQALGSWRQCKRALKVITGVERIQARTSVTPRSPGRGG